MGARPLRRAIQRLVEDPLSERLLNKEFTAGEIIVVDVDQADGDGTADADRADKAEGDGAATLVFRAIAGFEPPTVEMAVEAAD
jgi:ATP-dependent Clp protease ATP-binding subunit ClpC